MPFGGDTYDRDKDRERLLGQLAIVRKLLLASPGHWFTLRELALKADASEASVSARLRDLRKKKFGRYVIERARVINGRGLHVYRIPPVGDLWDEPVPVLERG